MLPRGRQRVLACEERRRIGLSYAPLMGLAASYEGFHAGQRISRRMCTRGMDWFSHWASLRPAHLAGILEYRTHHEWQLEAEIIARWGASGPAGLRDAHL